MICTKCKLPKPKSDFVVDLRLKNGHVGICRECDTKRCQARKHERRKSTEDFKVF